MWKTFYDYFAELQIHFRLYQNKVSYVYVFKFGFKYFEYIILLINTDSYFKVLLANYICFNFSKFTEKITSSKWIEK